MFEIRPYPEFSWSHSRAHLLGECPRAYFWRYYGSHNGWLPPEESSEQARLAYRLKNLTTLHQTFGTAVHGCARSCVEAVRSGKEMPTHSEMLQTVLASLRAVCAASKDLDAFLVAPKRRPMLHSMYYHGSWDMREVASVRTKLDVCLQHLTRCDIWDELKTVPPHGIVLLESIESVDVSGVLVYAAPDLVLLIGDHVVIIDWKTGAAVDEDDVRLQLATYALTVQRRYGWSFEDRCWVGRVINLYDGSDETFELSRLEVMRAAHRVEESVEEMHGFLEEVTENKPRDVQRFPQIHPAFRSTHCHRCSFYELCKPEVSGQLDRETP